MISASRKPASNFRRHSRHFFVGIPVGSLLAARCGDGGDSGNGTLFKQSVPGPRYSAFPVKVTCQRIAHSIAESASNLTRCSYMCIDILRDFRSGFMMSQTEVREFATNGRNMHGRQGSRDLASDTPTSLGRRNLPRASHACEWCRTKKVRCNQQQPCSNCIKHSIHCEYGSQRRSGRKEILRIQSKAHQNTVDREDQSSPLVSARVRRDDQPVSETPARVQASVPLGKSLCFAS